MHRIKNNPENRLLYYNRFTLVTELPGNAAFDASKENIAEIDKYAIKMIEENKSELDVLVDLIKKVKSNQH